SAERQGRLSRAVPLWANVARIHVAMGEFAAATEVRGRASEIALRLVEPSLGLGLLITVEDDWRLAMDEGWERPVHQQGPGMGAGASMWYWGGAAILAAVARTLSRMGQVEPAIQFLASVLWWIDAAPPWVDLYPRIVGDAAETLWLTERHDHVAVIE